MVIGKLPHTCVGYMSEYDFNYLSVVSNREFKGIVGCPKCKSKKVKRYNWYDSKENDLPLKDICMDCKSLFWEDDAIVIKP